MPVRTWLCCWGVFHLGWPLDSAPTPLTYFILGIHLSHCPSQYLENVMIALLLIVAVAFAIAIATTAIAIVDTVAFSAIAIAAIAAGVAIVALVVVIETTVRGLEKQKKQEAAQTSYDDIVHILANGTLQCDHVSKTYSKQYTTLQLCFSEELRKQYQKDCLMMLLKQKSKKNNNNK